jgi:phenylpropionate dioxygenase-like ring-hydroxylating dioxygenase large terminal subunit
VTVSDVPWSSKTNDDAAFGINKIKSTNNGGWFPILVLESTVDDTPIQIEVAGEKLVAWKNPINKEWSVMLDVCTHRLAPLSQGRVDPSSGCIECPYHGWQFEGKTGACTKIPQLDANAKIPASSAATVLPVRSIGELLWAFVPLPEGQASYFPTPPDEAFPELANLTAPNVRELPYSFDFLIENFVDAAHIPFAHHSLQGTRSDAFTIPMEVQTSVDDPTICEVKFTDVMRAKPRQGVLSFIPPSLYHFRTTNKAGVESTGLFIGCVPVSPGRSRVFVMFPQAVGKIFNKFPMWLRHGMGNRFLDSDLWIHDQERSVRKSVNSMVKDPKRRLKYLMPTDSDTSTRFWRAWWTKHMAASPMFGTPSEDSVSNIPLTEQRDWYEGHTKNCKSCKTALQRALKVRKFAPYFAAFLAAVLPNAVTKVFGVVFSVLADFAAGKVIRMTAGAERGEAISAAQFPTK